MLHSKANNQPINYSTTQTILFIVLIFCALVIFTQYAYGASVTLAWDPNSPAENIVGYRLYYGTESRNYRFMIDTEGETLKKLSGLEKGQNYYFAVTALNEEGQESDFSEEIAVSTCTYELFRKRRVFKATGGVKRLKIRTQHNCEWMPQSGEDWVRIMEGQNVFTGSGFVTYSVDPNPAPEKRIAVLAFGGKQFKVVQKESSIHE